MICAAPSNTLVRDKNLFRPRGIFVIRACPSVQEVSLLEGERGHWILNNLENSTMVTGNRHQLRSVWGVSAFPRHILLMFQCHCVLGRFAKESYLIVPPRAPPPPLVVDLVDFFNLKSFKIWFTGHWEKNDTKTIYLSDWKETDCVCLTFSISYKTDICLLIGDRGEDRSDESSPRWKPNNIGLRSTGKRGEDISLDRQHLIERQIKPCLVSQHESNGWNIRRSMKTQKPAKSGHFKGNILELHLLVII